jgi:hypothetical protein
MEGGRVFMAAQQTACLPCHSVCLQILYGFVVNYMKLINIIQSSIGKLITVLQAVITRHLSNVGL